MSTCLFQLKCTMLEPVGQDTLVTEGSLIYKAIQPLDFEAGCPQDGNKMSIFIANVTGTARETMM